MVETQREIPMVVPTEEGNGIKSRDGDSETAKQGRLCLSPITNINFRLRRIAAGGPKENSIWILID